MNIHAVKAIYDAPTFDPRVSIGTEQPLKYSCMVCPFEGNLEQGVEHVVSNQFEVKTKSKKK